MNVRTATILDRDDIYRVHYSAFSEDERATVAQLAVDLLLEDSAPKTLSLVAEIEGSIVGHTAFSPMSTEDDESFLGFVLSPLGIQPNHQKQGIGTKLVQSGIDQVSDMGADILFVYGDPNYYGRFGFSADAAEGYVPPYPLQFPYGWQALVLNENKHRTQPIKLSFVQSLSDPALW